MNNPFIRNNHLKRLASLNQVMLYDSPTVSIKRGLIGTSFIELLSAESIINAIKENGALKSIVHGLHDYELPRILNADLIYHEDPRIRTAAQRIIEEYAAHLVLLFQLLFLGEREAQEIRENWRPEHWAYWKRIKTIVLAGGLVQGALAAHIDHAFTTAFPDKFLVLADKSGLLPLLGVSRTINLTAGNILAFDFGHSYVKIGHLSVAANTIQSVVLKKTIMAPREGSIADSQKNIRKEDLLNFFHGTIKQALTEYVDEKGSGNLNISISIANYLDDYDVIDRGMYGLLADQHSSLNLKERLREEIQNEGFDVEHLEIMHDGTSAALCFNEREDACLVVLGSAIGVGFPLDLAPLLALDPTALEVIQCE